MEFFDDLPPWDLFSDDRTNYVQVERPIIGAAVPELERASANVGVCFNKLKDIENRLHLCDDVLEQLMVACRLKQRIETCASLIAEPSVRSSYKIRWLSTGHHLLLVDIYNETRIDLVDWMLVIQWTCVEENYLCSSTPKNIKESQTDFRIVPLPKLPSKTGYSADVLCSRDFPIPLLIRCQLVKKFKYTDPRRRSSNVRSKTIAVNLNTYLCCSLDLISHRNNAILIPNLSSKLQADSENFQIDLTWSFVGQVCKGVPSITNLLCWLLPSCTSDTWNQCHAEDNQVIICHDLTLNGHPETTLVVTVTCSGMVYSVKIETTTSRDQNSSSHWLEKLKRDMYARIALASHQLSTCPTTVEVDLKKLGENLAKARNIETLHELKHFVTHSLLPCLPVM